MPQLSDPVNLLPPGGLPTAAMFPPDTPVVSLKFHGKAFACCCSSKTFFAPVADFVWYCTTCKSRCSGEHYEAFAPARNDWRTPQDLWDTLHREYHFTLDAAADAENTKCQAFFDGKTPGTDALLQPWGSDGSDGKRAWTFRCWINPPYQPKGSVETWLKRGLDQAVLGAFSVFLVPMASSVAWFNDLVVPFAEWHTFRGRIQFDDPLANDHPTDDNNARTSPSRTSPSRTSPKQDNLLVIYNPRSTVLGHAAVRDSKTGKRLWTRPDLLQ